MKSGVVDGVGTAYKLVLPAVASVNSSVSGGMEAVGGLFVFKNTLSGKVDEKIFVATVAQVGTVMASVVIWPGMTVTLAGCSDPTGTGGSAFVCKTICNCQAIT